MPDAPLQSSDASLLKACGLNFSLLPCNPCFVNQPECLESGVTITLFTAVRKIQASENVKSEIWPFRTLAE
jgi:hypothetical protein